MAKKKVVVRGGGDNLYYVSDSSGVFYVTKGGGGMFGGKTDIGKARNLDDALAIIKSHSGRDIEKIE